MKMRGARVTFHDLIVGRKKDKTVQFQFLAGFSSALLLSNGKTPAPVGDFSHPLLYLHGW